MREISFKRHRFPPDVIRYAVWLYFRFTMSLRDVEDLLAERDIDVTYETVHCWANKFGPAIAANRHQSSCSFLALHAHSARLQPRVERVERRELAALEVRR